MIYLELELDYGAYIYAIIYTRRCIQKLTQQCYYRPLYLDGIRYTGLPYIVFLFPRVPKAVPITGCAASLTNTVYTVRGKIASHEGVLDRQNLCGTQRRGRDESGSSLLFTAMLSILQK